MLEARVHIWVTIIKTVIGFLLFYRPQTPEMSTNLSGPKKRNISFNYLNLPKAISEIWGIHVLIILLHITDGNIIQLNGVV